MGYLEYFLEGRYQKLLDEYGIRKKHLIMHHLICLFSAAFCVLFLRSLDNYFMVFLLVAAVTIFSGYLIKLVVAYLLGSQDNWNDFLKKIFPLYMSWVSNPNRWYNKALNKNGRWFYVSVFVLLILLSFCIVQSGQTGDWRFYFGSLFFGFSVPILAYFSLLNHAYQKIKDTS